MAISTEDFVKQIETMSVLDLSNLVKALEDRFGVSAAAAAAPAAAAAGPAAAAAPAEAQTEFTVVLSEVGDKKINVIKAVREVTSLGLTYNLLTRYTSFIAVHETVRRTSGDADDVDQPNPLPGGVSGDGAPAIMTEAPLNVA